MPKKDLGSYVPFHELADRYTMLQIEPLGFCRSDRPDQHSQTVADQILAVCDAEEIGEFAVWGFSQGAAMACTVARATQRARLLVCGGFNVLRSPSDAWLARMNRELRVPPAARAFWNHFRGYDWHRELRRLEVPMLMYSGNLDNERLRRSDQQIMRALGVDLVEFDDLNHARCGLGDPDSPATDVVVTWLHRRGWRRNADW